jgi:hypothetical protein
MHKNTHGSVLVHVLMTAVLVALIAASLLRVVMLRSTIASRGTQILRNKRYDEATLNKVMSYWNSVNQVCANNIPGYTCDGAPGACNCQCVPANSKESVVVARDVGGNCQLTISSDATDPL